MRILLVDDDAIARKALSAGLAEEGYEVVQASDGEEALLRARESGPDLILSDVLMPRMDGYSLGEALREEQSLQKTPLVFYSAVFQTPEDESLGRDVGASAFIHKDCSLEQFAERLKAVVEHTSAGTGANRGAPPSQPEFCHRHESVLLETLQEKVAELEAGRRELCRERRLFDEIVRTMPDVVFVLSLPELDARYIAPGLEHLLGVAGEAVLGDASRWQALMHEEDRSRVMAQIESLLRGEGSKVIALRMHHKEGGYRWIECHLSLHSDQQGHPLELVGVLSDISARHDALERINRVLHTLSSGNRSMVKASSESELLDNVCRVLSTEGAYPSVWVAIRDGNRLVPKGSSGAEAAAVSPWLERLVDVPLDSHILGEVIKGDKPYLLDEANHHDWRDTADLLRRGRLKHLLLLPLRYRDTSLGLLGIFAHSQEVFDHEELFLLDEMASDVGYGLQALRTNIAHQESMQRVKRTMLQTIEAVSVTLEKRDPYTSGHQQRVVQLAVAIAQDIGLESTRIEGLRLAALVHDIGKIHIPAEILNRPGRLNENEFGIIKTHPEVGYDILKGVEFDWPIARIVLQHHERCDGSGYPQGLTRDEIELEARIIGVADVVEAITSDRPYRPGLGLDVALDEITTGRGTRYDEAVVESCQRLLQGGFSWSSDTIAQEVQLAGTVRSEAH